MLVPSGHQLGHHFQWWRWARGGQAAGRAGQPRWSRLRTTSADLGRLRATHQDISWVQDIGCMGDLSRPRPTSGDQSGHQLEMGRHATRARIWSANKRTTSTSSAKDIIFAGCRTHISYPPGAGRIYHIRRVPDSYIISLAEGVGTGRPCPSRQPAEKSAPCPYSLRQGYDICVRQMNEYSDMIHLPRGVGTDRAPATGQPKSRLPVPTPRGKYMIFQLPRRPSGHDGTGDVLSVR